MVADVDVITSGRDLDRLYENLPLIDDPNRTKDYFRSKRFGRWFEPELKVEFMTGLEVRGEGAWHKIAPQTRQAIQIDQDRVFVPEREELVAMLYLFGRDKDLRRAASLVRD